MGLTKLMQLQKLAENYQRKNGRIYVYFDIEEEFKKAIDWFPKKGIGPQIMGYGTLETTASVVRPLLSAGLKFGIAENMEEIYNNKELIDYWNNLVEKEFGHPIKI